MKKSVVLVIDLILVACGLWTPITRAATDTQKLTTIQKGLAFLYSTQDAGGFWNASGYERAATGAAAFAFLSQQDKWGDKGTAYQAAVDKAMRYLVSTATSSNVSSRSDRVTICPGGAASCKAVYWYDTADSIYTTGLIAPAIALYGSKIGANAVATASGPLAGMTWGQIAQAITNAFAASQSTSVNGDREGGWRNFPGDGDSDSSATQAAAVALLYDETLGATTPSVVKDELKVWLGHVQNTAGAVCLKPGSEPCDHANTGGWLLAMRFVGYDLNKPQIQTALSFLNTNWQSTANNISYGNFGHPYAMWAVYLGLEATIGSSDSTSITNLLTDCGAGASQAPGNGADNIQCTWAEDYKESLVKNQKADGSWSGYSNWTVPLSTAFSIGVLAGVQIPSLPPTGTSDTTSGSKDLTPSASSRLASPAVASFVIPQANAAAAAASSDAPGQVRPHGRKGVTGVAVNGDAVAGASSTDNKLRVFNALTGQQLLVLNGALGTPTGLTFSPAGDTLSGVGRDSVTRVWNAVSGDELAELWGHEHAIRAIAASPDGKLLATVGEETRIMIWDLSNRKLSQILFGPTDFVNAVSFSPDSRLLAVGGEDARVLIFDVASGRSVRTLLGHAGAIDAVSFSPDGTVLASAGQDTVIHLWDPISGVQRRTLSGHQAPIRALSFSPDSQSLASGGEDLRIFVWDVATGAISKTLTGSTGAINSLAFSGPGNSPARGNFLASASESGDITLWNVVAGVQLRTIPVP
ncbi:MAG: hypothetical protein ACJ746_18455 [Bryobacteraceae bacterium]